MAKKQVDILIVPQGSQRSFKFKLSLLTVRIILGLAAFLLIFVVVMSVLHGKLLYDVVLGKSLKQENERLREYNSRIVELERELDEYKTFVARVAELAGIDFNGSSQTQTADISEDVESDTVQQASIVVEEEDTTAGVADSIAAEPDSLRRIPYGSPIEGWITKSYTMNVPGLSGAHPGVDFAAKTGTEVKATADGITVLADWDETYGNLVAIDHGNGFTTYYGHNSKNLVKVGDKVSKGDVVALSGNTGRSSAPHLHYEIRKDDVPVDPKGYLEEKEESKQ
jgi:murein DD-endopeptidase MepM/ murein hydrolase activator NlpD